MLVFIREKCELQRQCWVMEGIRETVWHKSSVHQMGLVTVSKQVNYRPW